MEKSLFVIQFCCESKTSLKNMFLKISFESLKSQIFKMYIVWQGIDHKKIDLMNECRNHLDFFHEVHHLSLLLLDQDYLKCSMSKVHTLINVTP